MVKSMEYHVEADWLLLRTCNFRCSYCFFSATCLGGKIRRYGTPIQWEKGFRATVKTWLLHITGGEPSVYPGFVELCDQLTQNHYLSINSNLSHDCIKAFVQRISPERIHFINASIHLEERQKRKSLNFFIERVHELQDAKFNVFLSLIVTPFVVSNLPKVFEQLETEGLFAIPKILRGTYEGKDYPKSYSIEQRRLICEYLMKARQKYETVLIGMSEPPTIDIFSDFLFLNGIKDYRGRLCSAGYRFVKITPNGTVVRCGSSEVFGNILFKNVRLLDAPKLCDTWYCPYFCEKYSVQGEKHYGYPSSNNTKFKLTRSSYSHLRGRMLELYYLIQTDGCASIVKMSASKLKERVGNIANSGLKKFIMSFIS